MEIEREDEYFLDILESETRIGDVPASLGWPGRPRRQHARLFVERPMMTSMSASSSSISKMEFQAS